MALGVNESSCSRGLTLKDKAKVKDSTIKANVAS